MKKEEEEEDGNICDSCAYFLAKVGYKKVWVSRETDGGEQSSEEDVKDEPLR